MRESKMIILRPNQEVLIRHIARKKVGLTMDPLY